jgi:hypothetical protein
MDCPNSEVKALVQAMSPALRARRDPITIGELTLACLNDHAGDAWPVLVRQLTAGGYITSEAGLRALWEDWRAHVLQSAGRVTADDATAMAATVPALARTLPDDLVTRVWAAMLLVWYRPQGGYLRTVSSSLEGLRPKQALGQYGVRMLIRARCHPDRYGAPIPGQGLMRIAYLPWRRLSSRTGSRTGRKRARPAAQVGRRGADYQQWVLNGVIAATPVIVVAAWFALRALHVPPHGPDGTVVGIVLAGLFGVLNLVLVYFLVLGFAMDGSPAARSQVRQPAAYLGKTIAGVLTAMFWVNLPLVILIAAVRLGVAALMH